MEAYEKGTHAYHATMPTDALMRFREVMVETEAYGFDKARADQQELGDKVRALLKKKGVKSVQLASSKWKMSIGSTVTRRTSSW